MSHKSIQLFSINIFSFILLFLFLPSCKTYTFKDISIPSEVKTVKIGFIDNKATYVNPKLSPALTDALQKKITTQTKLSRTNNDDAHYVINGFISQDVITTVGVANQQAVTNRLTIGVRIIFRNSLINKIEEFDIVRNFDFSGSIDRNQAEEKLKDEIIKNLCDEIFNKVFSNW